MSNAGKFNSTTNKGTAVCRQCGKRRQMANIERRGHIICIDCDFINGLENEHEDLGHEDGSEPKCPLCTIPAATIPAVDPRDAAVMVEGDYLLPDGTLVFGSLR